MSQTPHKCPCCDGWGVREVFQPMSVTTPQFRDCVACSGTGVIWSPPVSWTITCSGDSYTETVIQA